MSDVFDLLGDPVSPHHGRAGRPRHVPTPENRWKVKVLRDAGNSQPVIAAALGITIPTLLVHYFQELRSKTRAGLRRAERDSARANRKAQHLGNS